MRGSFDTEPQFIYQVKKCGYNGTHAFKIIDCNMSKCKYYMYFPKNLIGYPVDLLKHLCSIKSLYVYLRGSVINRPGGLPTL